MNEINLWEERELTKDQLHRIATALESDFPGIADGMHTILERDGQLAAAMTALPALFSRDAYDFWHTLGTHVDNVDDFYSPVPDVDALEGDLWDGPSQTLSGLDFDAESQVELLSTFESRYGEEFNRFPIAEPDENYEGYYGRNLYFETVDAEIAYSIVRDRSPDRIIEVGSGYSTRVIETARNHAETDCEHVVVDPHPDEYAERSPSVEVVERGVQALPLDFFESLGDDDILFIDTSHVVTIGSDVVYEQLGVVPRLANGVVVHFHDIFLPYEYPETWVRDWNMYFNEQYLLYGLLLNNPQYETIWTSYFMHRNRSDRLAAAIDNYEKMRDIYDVDAHGLPSSFWLEVRK